MEGIRFHNWAQTYSCRPERYFEPRTRDDLRQILRAAQQQHKHVKVVGGGHSPSALACTDHYMVSLRYFNHILSVDTRNRLFKAEAGAQVSSIISGLAAHGLALSVLPSISGLTLAGMIATATHGTGCGNFVTSGYVTEMEMMLASGEMLKCSAEVNQQIFKAAQVGIGALGVVLSVSMRCEPLYELHEVTSKHSLQDCLKEVLTRCRQSDFFRMYYYPFTDSVVCQDITKVPPVSNPAATRSTPSKSTFASQSIDRIRFHFIQFMFLLSTISPRLISLINRIAYRLIDFDIQERVDSYQNVLNFDCLFRQYAIEWAIPIECLPAALGALRDQIHLSNLRAHFPVEVRFCRADDIFLSPAYLRDCAYINIVCYRPYGCSVDKSEWFTAFNNIMLKLNGRPHLAKDHCFGPDELRKMFPKFDEFLAVRDYLDPNRMFENDYLRKTLGK